MAEQTPDLSFLTDREREALAELAKSKELTPVQVIRQALRLYQAVANGRWKVDTMDGLSKAPPGYERHSEDFIG
jgi:hypothetical protein